jgi:hypothetical protein
MRNSAVFLAAFFAVGVGAAVSAANVRNSAVLKRAAERRKSCRGLIVARQLILFSLDSMG